ncbi:MAG: hypothetical protein FWH16_01175 [Oscillospiraceae bacterium]|nr:hypothetical protein [Oscillospiraceae bacterium]
MNTTAWKSDNHKFVGKAFEIAYNNRMSALKEICGEVSDNNTADYTLEGLGGFHEYAPYNGTTLTAGTCKRGFSTIIIPREFNLSVDIGYMEAKTDQIGVTRKAGAQLGNSGAMTVYAHLLRLFGGAFNKDMPGGDGRPWASDKHWQASKGSANRVSLPDEAAGTFSNMIKEELSTAAITKAQILASRFVTPDGLPFLCEMDTLLVSPELEPKAKELCGVNAKLAPVLNPDGDTNAANPIYGMRYLVIGGGRDGFTKNQWAVCDSRLMKETVMLVYNEKPRVLQIELDNPLIDRYVGYACFGVGWGDARSIIFSTGG